MSLHKKPCIACIIRPLVLFGRGCGYTPIITKCSENNSACTFKTSWFWTIISSIIALLIGVMIIFSINDFNSNHISSTSTDIMQHVIITIDSMNQVTSILLIVINIAQSQSRTKALNKISIFIHDPTHGLSRAISEESEKKLFRGALKQIFFVVLLLIIQNIFTIVTVWKDDPSVHYKTVIVKGICFSISNCVFIMTGLDFSLLASLLSYMLVELDNELRNILSKAISRENPIHYKSQGKNFFTMSIADVPMDRVGKFHEKRNHLCDQIGQIRLAYCNILRCLKYLNRSMNPQLGLITVLVMISMVLNTYLIVQFIIQRNGKILLVVSMLRLVVNVGTIMHMISRAELLSKTVKSMFQHIITCETSNFNFHEMIQIEMIIKQFHNQPPTFSASDIFNFNAGILANIFGTVITFVLVALQFDFTKID